MSNDLIKALQKEAQEDAEIITFLRAANEKLNVALDVCRKEANNAADEITRLRADLAAVTAERDAAKRSAYEAAARFIEENVFNYSSGDQNYWSHRKGDNSHGLEYAREFRARAALEGVTEKRGAENE